MSLSSSDLQKLHGLAVQARLHSHSPYSKYKVGAAIQLSTGEVFSGCNIENASYGGTVCAERVAIFKAVSEKGSVKIDHVAVVVDEPKAWPPCGFCRQVIAEFAHSGTMIHLGNLQGVQRSVLFTEIFPDGFTPDHLKK